MLIRFEVSSDHPITEIAVGLNDGEPPLVAKFSGFPDGRYYRALAFKPVRNGDWILNIMASDDTGCKGESSVGMVNVVF